MAKALVTGYEKVKAWKFKTQAKVQLWEIQINIDK